MKMTSMVDDEEPRDAVRQLVKRFEFYASQGLAMAYVLAKTDSQEYARVLEATEVALKTVVQPINDADEGASAAYAALDDPGADWTKVVVAMLDQGAEEFTGEQAIERFKFIEGREGRFDAEMKNKNKGDEEPGIGTRG
jgi:hypothetical protein